MLSDSEQEIPEEELMRVAAIIRIACIADMLMVVSGDI